MKRNLLFCFFLFSVLWLPLPMSGQSEAEPARLELTPMESKGNLSRSFEVGQKISYQTKSGYGVKTYGRIEKIGPGALLINGEWVGVEDIWKIRKTRPRLVLAGAGVILGGTALSLFLPLHGAYPLYAGITFWVLAGKYYNLERKWVAQTVIPGGEIVDEDTLASEWVLTITDSSKVEKVLRTYLRKGESIGYSLKNGNSYPTAPIEEIREDSVVLNGRTFALNELAGITHYKSYFLLGLGWTLIFIALLGLGGGIAWLWVTGGLILLAPTGFGPFLLVAFVLAIISLVRLMAWGILSVREGAKTYNLLHRWKANTLNRTFHKQ